MQKRNRDKGPLAQQRHCTLCITQVKAVDFKEIEYLRRFTSSYGKIVPRRRSGVCAKHQRMLEEAIKRARIMALLPFLVR